MARLATHTMCYLTISVSIKLCVHLLVAGTDGGAVVVTVGGPVVVTAGGPVVVTVGVPVVVSGAVYTHIFMQQRNTP